MSGRFVDAAERTGDNTFNGENLVVAKLPELALAAFSGRTPLFCRMNITRFPAIRSGISTASMMRCIASSRERR